MGLCIAKKFLLKLSCIVSNIAKLKLINMYDYTLETNYACEISPLIFQGIPDRKGICKHTLLINLGHVKQHGN